jgi:pimeloyl-ACP methyl ester carboxylesterase
MFRPDVLIALAALTMAGCNNSKDTKTDITPVDNNEMKPDSISGYAPVNGLQMYYEIHGKGMPLVLIHGGGSTIQTTFGRVLPSFAKDRKVIAVELQAHGRTRDRDRPETFEQDADDVAAVLRYLKIESADFFGFSNGGNTTMQIAMRHPELVRKIVLGSTFFKREGLYPQFWESMPKATLKDMPPLLKENYIKIAPDSNGLIQMFEKDKKRMVEFKDWKAESIRSIQAPAFILSADQDVVRPEHAVEMYRLFPHAELLLLPGVHGAYIGEITTGMENSKLPDQTVSLIKEFLDEPIPKKN